MPSAERSMRRISAAAVFGQAGFANILVFVATAVRIQLRICQERLASWRRSPFWGQGNNLLSQTLYGGPQLRPWMLQAYFLGDASYAVSVFQMKQFVGLIFVLVLGVLIFAHEFIFFSHVETVTVIKVDAPEICSSGLRTSWLRHKPYRSSVPEATVLGYCGTIQTDLGLYRLPDMKWGWHTLHASRQEMHATLRPGCRYRVLIVGYGGRANGVHRVPVGQRISRIYEAYPCG